MEEAEVREVRGCAAFTVSDKGEADGDKGDADEETGVDTEVCFSGGMFRVISAMSSLLL